MRTRPGSNKTDMVPDFYLRETVHVHSEAVHVHVHEDAPDRVRVRERGDSGQPEGSGLPEFPFGTL